jgi:hypothetical protein
MSLRDSLPERISSMVTLSGQKSVSCLLAERWAWCSQRGPRKVLLDFQHQLIEVFQYDPDMALHVKPFQDRGFAGPKGMPVTSWSESSIKPFPENFPGRRENRREMLFSPMTKHWFLKVNQVQCLLVYRFRPRFRSMKTGGFEWQSK